MISLPRPWPTNPWPTRFRTVRSSPPGVLPEGLRFVTVQSPALGGRGDLAIFAPPDICTDATDVPIVVLLHGVYGSFWNWALVGRAHEVLSSLIEAGDVRSLVLAMPSDGLTGEGTAYLDRGPGDYERWIVEDVPACVAEATPGVTERSPLLLAGNSMGGFGALRLAARHRDRVAAAVAHSPITHLDDLAAFTDDDVGAVVGLPAAERSLATVLGDRDAAELPPMYIDCGTGDPLVECNRRLHESLVEAGVPHRYEEYDGGHDWESWNRRLHIGLRFLDRAVRPAMTTDRSC